MKKLLLLLALTKSIYVASQVERSEFFDTLKLTVLLDQRHIININDIKSYNLNVVKLDSAGFKDVEFYAVEYRDIGIDNDSIPVQQKNVLPFECYYVIGYNANQSRFYNLKGFRHNDFRDFFTYEIPFYFKKKGKLLDKNIFFAEFTVKNLDIQCLYYSLIENNQKNSDCLRSCKN